MDRDEHINSSKKDHLKFSPPLPSSQRSVGLDFCKGFGILAMLLIHSIIQQVAQYDGTLFVSTFANVPIYYLIPLVPIFLLALWGTAFTYFTVLGTTIQSQKIDIIETSRHRKSIFVRLMIALFIISLKRITWLIRDIIRSIPQISISWTNFYSLEADTLDAIVWAGVICPIVFYIYRKSIAKSPGIGSAFIFIGLAYLWLFFSPLLNFWGENVILWAQSRNVPFLPILFGKFVRGRFKLSQTLAFGFMGIAFGILLSKRVSKSLFQKVTWLVFFISTLISVIIIIFDNSVLLHFADEDVPLPLQIFNLGGVMLLMNGFMVLFDFVDQKVRQRRAKKYSWVSRFGLVSLTAFCLDSTLTRIPYLIMVQFFGPSVNRDVSMPYIAWKWWQILLYMLIVWLFWEGLLRLWEKIHFVGSLDWWVTVLLAKILGKGKIGIPVYEILYLPQNSN